MLMLVLSAMLVTKWGRCSCFPRRGNNARASQKWVAVPHRPPGHLVVLEEHLGEFESIKLQSARSE